jgi:hypothetical protein
MSAAFYPKKKYFHTLNDLNYHVDNVIAGIFQFESHFPHPVELQNLNNLQMDFHYFSNFVNDTTFFHKPISNSTDNPLKQYSNKQQRV